MAYLLDANVLIDAKNRYYRFDLAPGFWEWVEESNAAGLVFSVDAVQDELKDRGDDLSDWVGARSSSLFLSPDDDVVTSLGEVSTWVTDCGRFTPGAISDFLDAADYFIVGEGHAHNHVVVTNETLDPAARKRVKIPDACAAVGVESVTPWEMLLREGVLLDLRRA